MSEMAVAEPQDITFIDPLSADVALSRVDAVVNEMIEGAVGHFEDDLKRIMRRREVAACVRGILSTRNQLEATLADAEKTGMTGLAGMVIDGAKDELVRMFTVINPTTDVTKIEATVDTVLAGFRERIPQVEETKKRGKKAASV